ncbi:MAG: energy-coupling factor transporter transmembrane component T [Candidatus Latescibacterota bacterium]|nr:energy-coupling factor transporter transmembrane component T [Candidatus Latescibacterota bacterium]
MAGDSMLHHLDPRTKIASIITLMGGGLTGSTWAPVLLFSAIIVIAALLSRLRPALLLRNLRSFAWLLGLTAVLHALMTPGESLYYHEGLDLGVTREGLYSAALFTMRLVAVITAAALLTLTTSPMELTDGLERLLGPLRRVGVPAHELALMASISLRFIPVLAEEAERLQKAQMARGADFGGGPLRRARRLVPLLVPLFLSAFSRADRLALAMEARGYRGGEGRTQYRQLRLRRGDAVALAVTALSLAGLITLSWASIER